MNMHRALYRLVSAWIVAAFIAGSGALWASPVQETVYRFPSIASPMGGLVLDAVGNAYGTSVSGGRSGFGTVFKIAPNGTSKILAHFDGPNGSYPYDGLVFGPDGNLYGTAAGGGAFSKGIVFKVTPAGVLSVVASFSGTNGSGPHSGLLHLSDGWFYGTTLYGGAHSIGTVFKVSAAGQLVTLASFDGTKGSSPQGRLVQAHDGALYGVTSEGGSASRGVVFQVTLSGSLTVKANFDGTNGSYPKAGLTLAPGSDALWGTTTQSGVNENNKGTIFRMDLSGNITTEFQFSGSNGSSPSGGLLLGAGNVFYGITQTGGAADCGTLFRITTAGTFRKLYDFKDPVGSTPVGGLVQGPDKTIYGVMAQSQSAFIPEALIFKAVPPSDTLSFSLPTHVSVWSALPDVPFPNTLLKTSSGVFYGTTLLGGASGNGSVFKLTQDGAFTELVSFTGTSGTHPGAMPSTLVSPGGADLNFYGTLLKGGPGDFGSVFKISPAGVLTRLVQFTGATGAVPGSLPVGPLAWGGNGNFYGIASSLGSMPRFFRVTPAGGFATIAILNVSDLSAWNGLTYANKTFYGGSLLGGSGSSGYIFSLSPAGVFHRFAEFPASGYKGSFPVGMLVPYADETLYGVAANAGLGGKGTVFRLMADGDLSAVVSFSGSGGLTPGSTPMNGLIIGPDRNFYGTTMQGPGNGTVFRMTPAGALTELARLGVGPRVYTLPMFDLDARLTFGADGNLYGVDNDRIFRIILSTHAPTAGAVTATPTRTSAAVAAQTRPNGLPASVRFDYGTTTSYSSHTAPVAVAATAFPRSFSVTLPGLHPNTVYHVRSVVKNAKGTAVSVDKVFKTLP